MAPSLSLPPLERCLGTSPTQAEKSRPDRKALGSATQATNAVASAGPTPGIASSRLLAAFELQNLRLQHPQLGAKSSHTDARYLRHPLIAGVGHYLEKFLHPFASDRR